MLLIIAYGNTLRGDDGAGPALGELIERCCRQRSIDAQLLLCHQLTPELVTELIRPGIVQVLFCDARISTSGDHHRGIAFKPLEPAGGGTTIGHYLSPETLLLLAKGLYQCELPAWQVTVPSYNCEVGQAFSRATRQALDEAEPMIESFLARTATPATSRWRPPPPSSPLE
jgi:Ni,Fe-hydrogenase maturation factor